MKAILALAAVLVLSSTSAFSQNYSQRSYSETGIRAGQDAMSFAQTVRRKVKRRRVCYGGTCPYWELCCPTYDSWGEQDGGYVCLTKPAFCFGPY